MEESIFADLNGVDNTARMVNAALGDNGEPENNENATAAFAAGTYNFYAGTVQCSTYLPSIGEIGFLLPRLTVIENSFKKIFGDGFKINTTLYIWSSTEFGGLYSNSIVPYGASLGSGSANITTSAAPKVVWPFGVAVSV